MKYPLAVALMLAASLLTGCAGAKTLSKDNGAPGERAFRANCASCHGLPDPDEYLDSQWPPIVQRYGDMIGLDRDKQQDIIRFLQEHNTDKSER